MPTAPSHWVEIQAQYSISLWFILQFVVSLFCWLFSALTQTQFKGYTSLTISCRLSTDTIDPNVCFWNIKFLLPHTLFNGGRDFFGYLTAVLCIFLVLLPIKLESNAEMPGEYKSSYHFVVQVQQHMEEKGLQKSSWASLVFHGSPWTLFLWLGTTLSCSCCV